MHRHFQHLQQSYWFSAYSYLVGYEKRFKLDHGCQFVLYHVIQGGCFNKQSMETEHFIKIWLDCIKKEQLEFNSQSENVAVRGHCSCLLFIYILCIRHFKTILEYTEFRGRGIWRFIFSVVMQLHRSTFDFVFGPTYRIT